MLKKDWKKIFKRVMLSKGTDSLKMEVTPYRDWRIVVLVFFVGLVVSFGFNIYMSVEIGRDSFFTTTLRHAEGATLNKDGLTKILAEFSKKEAAFEKTKTERVYTVDPSL